ncbi:MAG: recombinase family protein [Eubacteriales bacterium]|nr:recombinase family protein [Eubacteriales bacterium]
MTQTGNAVQQKIVRVIPPKPELSPESTAKYKQLKVAAYCRVSTDLEEQQNSFETQVNTYTDKIQSSPEWCMAGIFADEGLTGTNADKRPEFMKMIKMCKQGKIDLIITKSISRFSRNTLDCLKYVRMLKELGVGVIFEKEGLHTLKMASEFYITIYGGMAQSESESLSGNVKWGKRQSAKKGNVAISYGSFLGYRRGTNGKPEIVPEEAETVQFIYDSFLAGQSFKQISENLEQKHILTPMGKEKWAFTTIRSILSNEKYKGDALLQKTFITDCISKKSKVNNGEFPQYYVENNHPAIIDKGTFNRVQEELARRSGKRKVKEVGTKTEQGKYSSKYALTELLICGDCGTPYRRVTWSRNGVKKIVWRCINRLDYGTKYCKHSPTLEEYKIQNAIISAIGDMAHSNTDVFETLKIHIGMGLQGDAKDESYAIRSRINELQDTMKELISLNALNGNDELYDERFEGLHIEIAELKARLKENIAKKDHTEKVTSRLDEIFTILTGLQNHPITYDDQIIRQMIECVKVLSADKLKIIFTGGIEMDVAI